MKRINPDTGKPFEIGDARASLDIQYFEEFWIEENKLDS